MKIRILIVVIVFACCSCENWLDLKPVDQPTENQIFKTAEGYRSALNGLYQNMGKSNLYGTNLAFGLVDCLSQQYDMNEDNNTQQGFREMCKMNYTNIYVSEAIENTWLDGYNVIANANNLIQNILQKSTPEMFEKGEMERNLILGEAYACRAFIHFDLLRLFAPAKVSDDMRNYIPYVEQYPNVQPQGIKVDECLEKIIADLNRAKELCRAFDTTALAMNAICEGAGRFYNQYSSYTELGRKPTLLDTFFKGRGYRLNYYSIHALLARVYQYADRQKEAFDYADTVLQYTYTASQWDVFTFYKFSNRGITSGSDNSTSAFEAKSNLRLVDNLIFAIYDEKAYDNLNLGLHFASVSKGSGVQYFVVKQKEIFQSENGQDEVKSDIRSSKLIYMANDAFPVSGKWFCHTDESKRNNSVTILPVIRATEMQYIMAEYYARQENWTEAARILNEVRQERECDDNVSFTSWSGFVKCLVNDARREWISEGQLFYLYKRLGAEVDFGDGDKHAFKKDEAVLPVPSSQSM